MQKLIKNIKLNNKPKFPIKSKQKQIKPKSKPKESKIKSQ